MRELKKKEEVITLQDVDYLRDLLHDRIDYMNEEGYSQEDIEDTINMRRN